VFEEIPQHATAVFELGPPSLKVKGPTVVPSPQPRQQITYGPWEEGPTLRGMIIVFLGSINERDCLSM
jgi:hypothetical protein